MPGQSSRPALHPRERGARPEGLASLPHTCPELASISLSALPFFAAGHGKGSHEVGFPSHRAQLEKSVEATVPSLGSGAGGLPQAGRWAPWE